MDGLVVLGCGFTGTEAARLALEGGTRVVATTRDPTKISPLRALGIDAQLVPELTANAVRAITPAGARVLVTYAPDGRTDRAVAPALTGHRIVYVSTTGVFGGARGRVTEQTPVDGSEPRAAARLEAEALYRSEGATVLRAAGIYGPWRGLHRRLLDGSYRVPGAGSNVVSRIHVADLAAMALAALTQGEAAGATFVVADDAPVPQIDVVRWLVDLLGVAPPPFAALDDVAVTLRHDRAVDNGAIKARLGITLRYPSYREGFAACLAEEGVSRPGCAAGPPGTTPGSALPPP